MGPPTANARAQLLFVEDVEALARQFKSHLERAGYAAHAEHQGNAALVYAAEHRPDLVLLDVVLPDMSGHEVCRELRRLPWIPVVMLTALSEAKDKLMGFGHGADAYLTKPVAIVELLSTIEVMLSRAEPRP